MYEMHAYAYMWDYLGCTPIYKITLDVRVCEVHAYKYTMYKSGQASGARSRGRSRVPEPIPIFLGSSQPHAQLVPPFCAPVQRRSI